MNKICIVTRVGNSIDEPYRSAFFKIALTVPDDGGMSADHASLTFHKSGLPIGPSSIRNHRRGVCPCHKESQNV
jgi:hypothetical protein